MTRRIPNASDRISNQTGVKGHPRTRNSSKCIHHCASWDSGDKAKGIHERVSAGGISRQEFPLRDRLQSTEVRAPRCGIRSRFIVRSIRMGFCGRSGHVHSFNSRQPLTYRKWHSISFPRANGKTAPPYSFGMKVWHKLWHMARDILSLIT
jgi:hypothetical protein